MTAGLVDRRADGHLPAPPAPPRSGAQASLERHAPGDELGAALRRRAGTLLSLTVLAASLATILGAGAWTAAVATYPASQPSVAQLEADFAAEQARADDLQVQLESVVGASMQLAAGMDGVGSRLGGDATSAQSLRTALAEARTRLADLRHALLAAGITVPTLAPARVIAAAPTPGANGTGSGTVLPSASPAPTPVATATYPPGVPASWPSSVPVPPMPSPCIQPQLEDNGVWNCQH